ARGGTVAIAAADLVTVLIAADDIAVCDRARDRRRRDVARAGEPARGRRRQRRASASGIDLQLDLVPVGVADRERLRRLAERLETVGFHAAARLGEVVERRAHLERDVIEAGHALGLGTGAVGARELARDVMMVAAGRKEHDAPRLAGAGFAQPEEITVKTPRRLEIADEERDVTQLAELPGGDRGSPQRCLHVVGSVPLEGHGRCEAGGPWEYGFASAMTFQWDTTD